MASVVFGIVITIARPLRARRRFFVEQAQRSRRQSLSSGGRRCIPYVVSD